MSERLEKRRLVPEKMSAGMNPFESAKEQAKRSRHQVLINCSNLHVGGGVAVAASLINEFSVLENNAPRLTVIASSEVTRNLLDLGTSIEAFAGFHTWDVHGARALYKRMPVSVANYGTVLTVFGPFYSPLRSSRNIMGFAQPWVAYPDNSTYEMLSRTSRLKARAKYWIQSLIFANADVLVVEHEHVRSALRRQRRFRNTRIEVVSNVVDSAILEPSKWKSVALPPRASDLRLGLVSHNYLHKNLAVLPKVRRALSERHDITAEFFVTFADEDYQECSSEFRRSVKNVGPLELAQSPAFNAQLDGVIFPTLLECFSATPLEALATRTPLFASDRPFVRETVGGHGVFFDPLDPVDIADSIASYFAQSPEKRSRELDAAFEYVTGLGYTSRDRALETLRILDEDGTGQHATTASDERSRQVSR